MRSVEFFFITLKNRMQQQQFKFSKTLKSDRWYEHLSVIRSYPLISTQGIC